MLQTFSPILELFTSSLIAKCVSKKLLLIQTNYKFFMYYTFWPLSEKISCYNVNSLCLSLSRQLPVKLMVKVSFCFIKMIMLIFWFPKCLNNLSTSQLILNLGEEKGDYLLNPAYIYIIVSCFLPLLLSLFFLKIILCNEYCYSSVPSQLTIQNYDLMAVQFMFSVSVHIYLFHYF